MIGTSISPADMRSITDILREALSPETYFSIKSDFEESNLPYTVDVVQFSRVDDRFKEIAKKDIIPLFVSQ